jgi:hypothetical protein
MGDNIVMTPVPKTIMPTGIYSHTSYSFCLTELSSLFKRHKEDVIKFLIKAYDCEDYDNTTKHMGIDRIRRMCLNFSAGTTIDFIKESYKAGLFGQGFASRTLWIFESKTRFDEFFVGEKDKDMEQARQDLLQWIKRLATLLGPLNLEDDTKDWLQNWYKTDLVPKRDAASAKMHEYYGRKRVNLLKLAAAVHFADNLSMTIPLSAILKALKLLESIEPNMAAGFNMSGRNELHQYTLRMLSYLKKNALKKSFIQLTFGMDMTLAEIDVCIKELELSYGVRSKIEKGEVIYYI